MSILKSNSKKISEKFGKTNLPKRQLYGGAVSYVRKQPLQNDCKDRCFLKW